jgi:pimeloyl-ACP methyl ester carboxylesterase
MVQTAPISGQHPAYWRAGVPNVFEDAYFNFQFARALSYASFGGAALGECFVAANSIKGGDFDSWRSAWTVIAERVERLAGEAEHSKYRASAAARYLRAYNYYRAAEFLISHKDPLKRKVFLKAQNCFRKSLTLTVDYVGTPVRIPYGKATLPGYFLRPEGHKIKRPTLINHGGGDGSNEECLFLGAMGALRRGYNCLIFDGPGQRGALYEDPANVYRSDYEVVIKAVVDFTLAQPGIDSGRLALIGWSLGGYTAARGAAHDSRIKALILSAPLIDLYRVLASAYLVGQNANSKIEDFDIPPEKLAEIIQALYDKQIPIVRFGMDQSQWILGGDTILDFLRLYQKFRLDDDEIKKIQCPTLCLTGTDEGPEQQRQLGIFKAAMTAPCEVHVFTSDLGAELHCEINNQVYAQEVIFDWLQDTMRVA